MSGDCQVYYGSDPTLYDTIDDLRSRLSQMDTSVETYEAKLVQALQDIWDKINEASPSPSDPSTTVSRPSGLTFSKATAPTKPDFSYAAPAEPGSYSPGPIDAFADQDVQSWPVGFTDVFSTYEPGSKPTLPTYTAPTITVPTVNAFSGVNAPTEPTMHTLNIPAYAGLTMPDLSGITISDFNETLPGGFTYVDVAYGQEIIDDLLVKIRAVMGGEMLIPGWVWDGIWSRGVGNLKREERAGLREAQRLAAKSGWMLPGVVRLAAEDAVRQKSAEALSELTRENTVKQAELYREDIVKSVEMGLAIENLLVNVHNASRERVLKAAIETHNASVQVYQAALEAFKVTQLQAKEILLQIAGMYLKGEELKVSVFETEMKAAGLAVEIDKNLVEVYKAQWSGEETKTKAYAAYVQALESQVRGQQVAVEAYGKQVESNNTILQGWAIEWDAYLKRLKPAELRIQAHEASSSHFGRLVQKYQADIQGESARVESDIKAEGLQLQALESELKRFQTLWSGIQTKLDSLTKVYATDAEVYKTETAAESSRIQSIVSIYDTDIKKAGLDLNGKIEGMKTRLSYWGAQMQAWSAWQSAAAGAYAQLGASAYSAANFSLGGSASLSSSLATSQGVSCSTTYSHTIDETG